MNFKLKLKRNYRLIRAYFRWICIQPLIFYKKFISPILPTTCIYEPTCSIYSMQAILRFGLFKGVFYTFLRLLRCNPFHEGGIDTVPENLKGDTKWVL